MKPIRPNISKSATYPLEFREEQADRKNYVLENERRIEQATRKAGWKLCPSTLAEATSPRGPL
jgi:hypothetical protein